ncbi:MAG TPA: alkaline phosphatase family protein [Longimicrobium sp.]|nr:alkaline phosphatase family protein [Longimicrobium sp.]
MPAFRRIVIVMFENASRDTVLANQYMRDLRKQGVWLSSSHGVTHPSQPNYIALTGADTLGFNSDDPGWVTWVDHSNYPPTTIKSIVDLIEAQGLTWKAYAEDLDLADQEAKAGIDPPYTQKYPDGIFTPYPAAPPGGSGLFARKHVPFLSYPNIVAKENVRELIVDFEQFQTDIANDALPEFSFVVPNLLNDGHNGPGHSNPFDRQNIANIQNFLQNIFLKDDPISSYPPETLIVLTFDEAYPVIAPYNIYTLLIGDMLQAGTVRTEPYNHYSLLRSIEINFGLGSLGRNDVAATPYWFLQS